MIFKINDHAAFRLKMLNWVNDRFSIFCLLDNREYEFSTPAFECLLGAGAAATLECNAGNAFDRLKEFHREQGQWLFGHLGYGLKDETEQLISAHADTIGFADMHFFVPQVIVRLTKGSLEISGDNPDNIYKEIAASSPATVAATQQPIVIQQKIPKTDYLPIIEELRKHILRGDCYEINFCQEFFATAELDPVSVYLKLTDLSPNPFSSFYRQNGKFCICASPERFLQKKGSHIISQPIKGTSKRYLLDEARDSEAKAYLQQSAKERSENVMVVDMVRNDLSRVCIEGSVKVDELFGVYSFPQVHQMISTVSGELREGIHFTEAIRACFPMGSMTGTPKKSVMKLIEQYERSARGLFSGAIGYISPGGDFDFNVVIRSIFYNAAKKYISFQAGGGITFFSDGENEYEESLLKAKAIMEVLR